MMARTCHVSDVQQRFDFDVDPLEARDAEARRLAVDPRRNVALEASAGTGKTRVLVERYVRLLLSGIEPRNILAMTFTRKAAAEMRQRILRELATRAREHSVSNELLETIRESAADITISTIDAFCLQLLREFPLEADVDPAFELADETETPRLVEEALERTIRTARGIAATQPDMALLLGELGEFQLRQGLARLLDRRLVAWDALDRFAGGATKATTDAAVGRLLARVRTGLGSVPGGIEALLLSGPAHLDFSLFARDLQQLLATPAPDPATTQALLERVRDHFLTQGGEPRKRFTAYRKADFRSSRDFDRHLAMVQALGPYLIEALDGFRRDMNLVLARGVRQLFAIALKEYQRILRKNGVLDFSDVLERTIALLSEMDEFSRSRFKLESRYQHVLVDEFQDTSRAQWSLVELLVRSWGAGMSVTDREPTIFIVGDRKQSIYAFRDAEVAVLDEAARYIEALRPIGQVRTAITRSFRSIQQLLHFVNDAFTAIDKVPDRADAFRYSEDDRFPLSSVEAGAADALGIVAAATDEQQAEIVAAEIARLLACGETVRDRDTGVRRAVRPEDIGVLFRTREGHRIFEAALARRRVPYYVYKGLGFFDADEIKDVLALLSFLARPQSELSAAAFLRSRFVWVSDDALKQLAPGLSAALIDEVPAHFSMLHPDDQRRLELARGLVPRWLRQADRIPPSELLDGALAESAYAAEIAGPAYRQARENLKKIRSLVRRMQNRGYATLGRVVAHLSQLVAGGDESNAIVDAVDAVSLMTAHAAKGLEFPVVFVVNIHRGSGGSPDSIRVSAGPMGRDDPPSVSIGTHVSEADLDLDARELEEDKRLLYVAMTRARDRLYLAGTLGPDQRFAPGKGGLGRTLPASLIQLFNAAATSTDEYLTWDGETGVHRLRLLRHDVELERDRGSAAPVEGLATDERNLDRVGRIDDFLPLAADGGARVAVTDVDPSGALTEFDDPGSSVEVGVLVHRALEAGADDPEPLLRGDERALCQDVERLLADTREALSHIRAHPRVARLLSDEQVRWRRHEVPFSWLRGDGTIVRGTIDCVVQRADEVIEVFEFKTGRPDDRHRQQLETYVEAARALFPGRVVEGHLIYAQKPTQLSPK
jgi:ATP-dependent helicase/nuclease subunit A